MCCGVLQCVVLCSVLRFVPAPLQHSACVCEREIENVNMCVHTTVCVYVCGGVRDREREYLSTCACVCVRHRVMSRSHM